LSGAGIAYAIGVASAAGFPSSGTYSIGIDNEVMQVTGGQGTRAWNVSRAQLGSSAAAHSVNATVTALATDWYATFSGVPTGSQNLKVSYLGKNCGNTTGTGCTSIPITPNPPQQTVKICDWTVSGAAGCSSATSSGWVTLPPPPPQPQSVGSPKTTLAAAVTDTTGTSITVASNTGFPAAPYYVVIDGEVMQVTTKGGGGSTTWAISRGQLGSAAATHSSGASVGQEVFSAWTLPGSGASYIGAGGEVRVLVHTQRWTAPSPTAFSTWGNLMKLVYDAP
jgi:hypothetical protein